jgi:hypothetical protein
MQNMIYYLVLWIAVIAIPAYTFAEAQPPTEGGLLPDIVLSVPENPDHANYLGLTEGTTFRIPQIKAEVVIIEIFSMY